MAGLIAPVGSGLAKQAYRDEQCRSIGGKSMGSSVGSRRGGLKKSEVGWRRLTMVRRLINGETNKINKMIHNIKNYGRHGTDSKVP